MIKLSMRSLVGVFLISLYSSSAWATMFRVDFYTEITRTVSVDTYEIFDRTSATGSFVFDNMANALLDIFPDGNPIVHLKNERFINGVDATDDLLLIDPYLGAVDWFVGLDNVSVSSMGSQITDFLIDTYWYSNADPAGDFANTPFRQLVGAPGNLTQIYIPTIVKGAIWSFDGSPPKGPSSVSWTYTTIPNPSSIWLFATGLIGLLAVVRKSIFAAC